MNKNGEQLATGKVQLLNFKPSKLLFYLMVVMILGLHSCIPEFYSENQSAKTVGKGNVEIAPTATRMYLREYPIMNQFGSRVTYGIRDKMDFSLRYTLGSMDHDRIHNYGAATKIIVKENKMAFNLFMGITCEKRTVLAYNFQPSFLFTSTSIKNKMDFTFAPKLVITQYNGTNDALVLPVINFNTSLSSNLSAWFLRPEVGLLFYSYDLPIWQVSISYHHTLHIAGKR